MFPPPPSPGPLPRGLRPTRTSSLVPRSLRYLGLHGTERAPQELAREGSHHPSYWSLGLQRSLRRGSYLSLGAQRGLTAPFVLEPWPPEIFTSSFVFEPWGAERAHSTLRTGALASRALYVVVRIWSLGAQRGLTSPFVLEPWRPELFTSSFAFGRPFWTVLEPSWAVWGPFWAVLGRLGGLARRG